MRCRKPHVDVVAEETAAGLGLKFEFDADLRQGVLGDLGELPGALCVVEQIADDELATVLLPERAASPPAQGVQLPFRLFRVVGDNAAVVLVAVLAGDEDVVVQWHRVAGEAVLGDPGDGVSVDALGDP